jgi:predicted MFS family arabinose efflux permease
MAFQFQSVAAVAPLLGTKFGAVLPISDVLIGLYFTPGVALSLPAARSEKVRRQGHRVRCAAADVIGQVVMMRSDSWSWQIAGRLIAGGGGVLLNVLMSKMVTDWFAGQEIATAMAIFVNSWPAGVAISLLILPAVGTAYGVSAVYLSIAALIGLAILLLVVAYRSPSTTTAAPSAASRLDRNTLFAVIISGLIWGLFNIGFAMIFSFGPTLLVERGWSITAAGSAISIVLWLAALGGMAGGFLADWTRRPQSVLVVGCIMFALLMMTLPRSAAVIPLVIAIGLISALPSGPIMSLPARVLQPQTRAIGMGIFYTVYYAAMMLGPAVAGAIAKSTGQCGGRPRLRDGGPACLPSILMGIQPDCCAATAGA